MTGCSNSSEVAFTLRPDRSKLVLAWWIGLHGLLGSVAWQLFAGAPTGLALAGISLLHALARWPRRPPPILHTDDGRWAVPAWGRAGLELGTGTSFTNHWARLVLWAGHGERTTLCLTRDQLGRRAWWRLQTRLRQGPHS